MKCRHCASPLHQTFLDLGFAPPSNAYLTSADLSRPEKYFPLRLKVCNQCWLVQTEDYAQANELFNASYAYFSSTSSSWLKHAKLFSEHITTLLGLNSRSHVVEVGSNDGYLLRNFVAAGIPCLGIEPSVNTAAAAQAQGIPVVREFFGEALGKTLALQGHRADLITGNNVYAHVPDINDFTRGLAALLNPEGVVTLEFPHLLQFLRQTQFDTAYHEHFSYLSLGVLKRIFAAAGLRVWDVQELPTHGGSLRVYGCLKTSNRIKTANVDMVLAKEDIAGLEKKETYTSFQAAADNVKNDILSFLIKQKRAGRLVAAYGAAAKGSTLLNYAGIKPDLLPYVCDLAISKQGKYLPGSHIPIISPEVLRKDPPSFLLILPWNIVDEVRLQFSDLEVSQVQFVTAIPQLRVL